MSEKQPWGYSLLLDCKGGNISSITDPDNITNFTDALVKAIDMKAYGPTILEHFATHDPDKAGYSMVQLIETSNMTAHFVDKNGDFYVDIFSCKPFEVSVAEHIVDYYFQPKKIDTTFVYRG